MKHRFVVMDRGTAVHRRNEACPPWCHLCPHMADGVMPYCYGSVCQNVDEFDLLHCTCDPNDPIVAHVDLISRTDTLIRLLREKRRERHMDLIEVERLARLARAMKGSVNQRGLSEAWADVAGIAERLRSAVRVREDAGSTSAVDARPSRAHHPNGGDRAS